MTRIVDQTLLDETSRRIRAVTAADRIILFGSAVRGALSEGSDLDLLVLAPTTNNSRQARVRIAEALRDLELPLDVFVMETAAFEESKGVIGGLAYPANKYGITNWWDSGQA
jgi:predicted nucleotidyltransferase